ncbi:unnamed protein product [Discosporangium mesarthrocarpum]
MGVVTFWVVGTLGIQLEVYGGQFRCIKEAVRDNIQTTFSFTSIKKTTTASPKLQVDVHSSEQKKVCSIVLQEEMRSCNIEPESGGTYDICFINQGKDTARVEVSV